MTIDEMLNLNTGRYQVFIKNKQFTMFISHDGSYGPRKISFAYDLGDDIWLNLEGCQKGKYPLVKTINGFDFVLMIEAQDIKFRDPLDYVIYGLKNHQEFSDYRETL
jgi:hypothetical protein